MLWSSFCVGTMPKPIQNLAKQVLSEPVLINDAKGERKHSDISEVYYLAKEKDKDLALIRLFDGLKPFKSIIFCKTKRDVERLHSTLASLSYNVCCLHGDMAQGERQRSISIFRSGECKILVATDVAGRGLNIIDISHVFNYHIPFSADGYTHRIGRTGRAGRKGTAISILSPSEYRQVCRTHNVNKKEMDIRPLPSLAEIKEQQQRDLIKKVISQDAHQASKDVLSQLQSEMNIYDIGENLLSILLNEKELSGPENLGMKLEEIHEENNQKKRSNRRPFGSKRGFKNGGRVPRRKEGSGSWNKERGGKKKYGGVKKQKIKA